VYHQAKIVFLDQPQREIEALLTDISGGGMRLVANQDVPEDQMVCIEVGQHLVLAEVRRSAPRGSRFVIGAEKVHTLNLLTLPESMNKQDRLQALVDDYHLRIQFALESAASKDAAAPQELLDKPDELLASEEELVDSTGPAAVPASVPPALPEPVASAPAQAAVPIETPKSAPPPPPVPAPADAPALETTRNEAAPVPSGVAEIEPGLAPPIPSNPAPAVEPPPHLTTPVDVDFGQLRIMLPQTQEIEPLPGEAPPPQKLQLEAPTALLEAPAAPEVGASPTEPLEPIWLAPPPKPQEEWDALRAVALDQHLNEDPEPEGRPRSRKRIAALVGALVSVLALTALLFGPIRKSVIELAPFASATEKAAKKAPTESEKELVVHVDSAAPPGPDQVSDVATGTTGQGGGDKAPDKAPVAASATATSATAPVTIPASPALPALAQPVSTPPRPVAAAKPVPHSGTGSAGLHSASVKATAASWISTCTDGKVAGRLLPAGGELEIEFSRQAQVVVGNAAGVQIELEGKPLGPLGPEGKSRLVELTPSGFRVLATGALDDCGKE
jgi:hypothetical protein